jgi:hypothetical protein
MNTKAKVFTGALAIALSASALLTASNASARPYDDDYYSRQDNGVSRRDRDHNERYQNRRERWNDREFRFNNRDDYRYNNRRNVYQYRPDQQYQNYNRYSNVVRLPDGCRRVVYRDRTYYTRNNYDYYTYDPGRRGFIVVNFPGIRIGF